MGPHFRSRLGKLRRRGTRAGMGGEDVRLFGLGHDAELIDKRFHHGPFLALAAGGVARLEHGLTGGYQT